MIYLKTFLIALYFIPFIQSRHHHSDPSESNEEATEKPPTELEKQGKEIMDRMMVNMAGAMVKSVFPEMDKFERKEEPPSQPEEVQQIPQFPQREIRRSPYPSNYGLSNQEGYGINPASGGGMSGNLGQLGPIVGALASSGALDTLTGGGGQGQGMDPRLINEMRNQAYLSELAKHQHELTQYSAKQMEYLDQQRRYQQAIIDHQAEAALLMQKEQQKAINEAMGQAKAMYAKQRLMAAKAKMHGSKTHAEPEKTIEPGDRALTSDQDLRSYFKKKYGIEIPNNGAELTDDERETLRILKIDLVKDRAKGLSMDKAEEIEETEGSSNARGICGMCKTMNIRKLKGSWTQLYGNPDSMKQTFGTIRSLERMKGSRRHLSKNSTTKKPSCVGLEIGAYRNGEAETNFYFRDSDEENSLHEMKGEVQKSDESNFSLETDLYSADFCVVKSGPADADQPEFIVLAETKGAGACRVVHVFSKDKDEFERRFFDDVSEFMKEQVHKRRIRPVGALPNPELCQLDAP
ncbi:unnamed protein product, partial [Mesorhabditis belari]|uniref:Uncharacterized protein n=1 Tax=Mesorhabditis belari TaxID=2138241 RepID=A0AAF3EH93_9BILA